MSLSEVADMYMHSLQLSWDAYPSHGTSFDSLDIDKINTFIKKVNENGRFNLTSEIKANLRKLNLLKGEVPTNAAKLLFAKEQTVYNIHIGRFKTSSMIIDDKMIKNTLFESVEEAMKYIISHIKVAFEFTGSIQRTEIFEYPISAIRELVLNSVVHRDYTSPVDTQIKIFDQSITIFNPGKLYGSLTIDQLKTDSYQSQTRNKLIAEAFYLTRDIEKYGSGYIRIREAIKDYPSMKFEYQEVGNGYLASLSYSEQKTTLKTAPKTAPKTTREKIIQHLSDNPEMKIIQLSSELSITIDAVKQHIAKLKRDGILERLNGRKKGRWLVK